MLKTRIGWPYYCTFRASSTPDLRIYGTGFHVTDQFIGRKLFGRDGLEIHDAWRNGMGAYLGVIVSGFPNFFILLGPNTGLGHNSVVMMIEAQVGYVINCLKLMRERNVAAMEVRAESQQHFAANPWLGPCGRPAAAAVGIRTPAPARTPRSVPAPSRNTFALWALSRPPNTISGPPLRRTETYFHDLCVRVAV